MQRTPFEGKGKLLAPVIDQRASSWNGPKFVSLREPFDGKALRAYLRVGLYRLSRAVSDCDLAGGAGAAICEGRHRRRESGGV